MAGNKKKKPAMSITQPPPRASLTGIPPELRNMIYQHVADDVKEVNFSIRKLTKPVSKDSHLSVDDRLRQSLSKHSLSQTCRQLRVEFDPIHKHKALIIGVAKHNFDVENYDVDCLEDLAKVLPKTRLYSLRKETGARLCIRFLLNTDALASALNLEKVAKSTGGIGSGYRELKSLMGGPHFSSKVVLIFKRKSMPLEKRRLCIKHKENLYTLQALDRLSQDVLTVTGLRSWYPMADKVMVEVLRMLHKDEHREYHSEQARIRKEMAEKNQETYWMNKLKIRLGKKLEGQSAEQKLLTLEKFLMEIEGAA